MAMNYLGDFTTANTAYVYFNTFDSNDPSASVTMTGLALGDILIYKNGSVTQRASTAGFALLDTDGIDFDGKVGIHGFSIDLSDDDDAGFFVASAEYVVVVDTITVDTGAIRFVAASFSIERAGGALALLKGANSLANIKAETALIVEDTDLIDDGTSGLAKIASDVAATLVDTTGLNGAAMRGTDSALTDKAGFSLSTAGILAIWHQLTAAIVTASTIGKLLKDNINATISSRHASGAAVSSVSGNVDGSVGSVTGAVGSVTGHTAQTGDTFALANGASGFVATKAVVDALDALTKAAGDGDLAAVKTAADAVKVQTDKLTFTVANVLDANTLRINSAALVGDGSATPWDGI